MYIIHITCDKEKVNEMKLHIVMLMNACAHEMQVPNVMLNTRVLHNNIIVKYKLYTSKWYYCLNKFIYEIHFNEFSKTESNAEI